MPKVFSGSKGLPRSLARLKAALRGGIVGDTVKLSTGASAEVADVDAHESEVLSGGTAGNEIVQLPAGTFIGQRHLVTFEAEGNVSDVVRINAAAGVALRQQENFGTGTPAAVTNVDLDTPGEYALFEFIGGATPSWNLVYTTGAVS